MASRYETSAERQIRELRERVAADDEQPPRGTLYYRAADGTPTYAEIEWRIDHAMSSYGMPVLVVVANHRTDATLIKGQAYGPAELPTPSRIDWDTGTGPRQRAVLRAALDAGYPVERRGIDYSDIG